MFSDGTAKGRAGYYAEDKIVMINTPGLSAQLAELSAILLVFYNISEAFDLYTDSLYVATSIRLLETCGSLNVHIPAGSLFAKTQACILARKAPFHIGHLRTHSGLPGFLVKGNASIDQTLVGEIAQQDPVSLALKDHGKFHWSNHILHQRTGQHPRNAMP